jgi:transformation/transcription domain-associated protein
MTAVARAGEKLIDHLKKWLEPDKLLSVAHSWDPGQECHIAAAILDLFHLLPPPAVKFLETGVRAVHAVGRCPLL